MILYLTHILNSRTISFIKRLSFVLLFVFSPIILPKASAQNNIFGVHDSLYAMYLQAGDSISSPTCLDLCDKMFNKALEMEDKVGQSLALTQKSVLTEAQNCNTMKISYRYVIWKQYITFLLMLERTDDAYKEIELMQKDAMKENVENGIVKAYFMYAFYFMNLRNIPAALENFDKGFELAKEDYKLFDPIEVANYTL